MGGSRCSEAAMCLFVGCRGCILWSSLFPGSPGEDGNVVTPDVSRSRCIACFQRLPRGTARSLTRNAARHWVARGRCILHKHSHTAACNPTTMVRRIAEGNLRFLHGNDGFEPPLEDVLLDGDVPPEDSLMPPTL